MQHSGIFVFPPLPARAVPRPWEDLASLVSRMAAEMSYKNPGWILHPEEIPSAIQPYNLCLLRRIADYQFLERLLCLDEETIYGLTLHRFASRLQVPEAIPPDATREVQRPLLTRYLFQTFFHPYSATKVCSACLADDPQYARLYWSALPAVACLRHRILLTDRCPVCRRPIPLLRPSVAICPRCKTGDYRNAPAVPMPEDPLFHMGQALILHHLGVECMAPDTEDAEKRLAPHLQLLPWQFFQLLDALRCTFGPLFPDAPFLQASAETRAQLRQRPRPQSQLSLLEWSVVIATSHWLFASWPDNFFAFLDAFPQARSERRRKRDRQRATGIHRDFGVFYEKWLYKRLADPAFAFLHEAFELYLREHYTGGEVTGRLRAFKEKPAGQLPERPYLTKGQTKTALGIGEDVLQALLAQGVLGYLKKPTGQARKRTMFLIDRSSVETLRREWAGSLSLGVVARSCLGVTKGVVLMLEQAGLLTPMRGPFVDGYKFRFYRAADVEQLTARLLQRAVKAPADPPEQVPLSRAACVMGIPLVTILADVLGGNLTPIDPGSAQPVLTRLALSNSEIQSYLHERERRRHEELGLLTVCEAAALLAVDDEVLLRWIKQGFIRSEREGATGRKTRLLIRQEVLDSFRRSYCFTEEVADLLQVIPQTVHKYVRKGILRPVAGRRVGDGSNRLLFLRQDVEALVPPGSLSVGEAARTIGISPARVYALLRTGKLTGLELPKGTAASVRIGRADLESYRRG